MASTDAGPGYRPDPTWRTSKGVTGPSRARIPARTLRQDRWWLSPLATFVAFSLFVVYATVRALSLIHI